MNWKMKIEEVLLVKLAKSKTEIQEIQLWIDDARTNHIARIRNRKTKDSLNALKEIHKILFHSLKKLKGWND